MTQAAGVPQRIMTHRRLLVPLGLVVFLTLLYVAGVPWVVVALDEFWEGVDRLVAHPRLMSFLTVLCWAIADLFVYRFYRLHLWDKRVSSALAAVATPSSAGQQIAWRSLNHLATAKGLPKDERAWLSAVHDDLHEQAAYPSSTSPICARCGRG